MRPAKLVTVPPLSLHRGHCWIAELPEGLPPGDTMGAGRSSGARLFEDGVEIGPGHAMHDDIARRGGGRFSHWGSQILLSASDNGAATDHRLYTLLLPAEEVALEPAAVVPPPRPEEIPAPHRSGLWRRLPGGRHVEAAARLFKGTARERADRRYQLAEEVFERLVPGQHLSENYRSFFRDTAYAAFYERFGEGNYHSYDRRYALAQFARMAADLPGDFAECGVYRGATAYLLARALREAAPDRRVHLFDSFAGLSAPATIDGAYWHPGDMAVGLAEVRTALAEVLPRVDFHPGWIPERFGEVADRRFALVHLDVDLHQPTADAVVFFYPRLVDRGVIVCDDYGFETCPGARRALDDFFADKPEKVLNLPTGQGVVIRRID